MGEWRGDLNKIVRDSRDDSEAGDVRILERAKGKGKK